MYLKSFWKTALIAICFREITGRHSRRPFHITGQFIVRTLTRPAELRQRYSASCSHSYGSIPGQISRKHSKWRSDTNFRLIFRRTHRKRQWCLTEHRYSSSHRSFIERSKPSSCLSDPSVSNKGKISQHDVCAWSLYVQRERIGFWSHNCGCFVSYQQLRIICVST